MSPGGVETFELWSLSRYGGASLGMVEPGELTRCLVLPCAFAGTDSWMPVSFVLCQDEKQVQKGN